MGETVLDFPLEVICEAIAEGGVDAPHIVAPFRAVILVSDGTEKLLVPTQRPEELRSYFVFHLDVVGEGVGIAEAWHLEARLVKLCPQLEVMPCEGNILRQNELPIVANIATGRERTRSFGKKIGARAAG